MSTEKCCKSGEAGCDVVTKTLCRVGISRSMLITLALLPFAWEGVNWVGGAIRELWGLIAGI